MMRRTLNALYDSAAALAALCMVGLLIAVLLSILGRQFHFHIPGIDAYAGYLMAGTASLALAHTLKHGEHIRVTLLLAALKGHWKHLLELWALGLGTLLTALYAWYSLRLVWFSHAFNDVSTSNDATPLWLPQIGMAVGAVVLAVAMLDELILQILGRRVVVDGEALHNE